MFSLATACVTTSTSSSYARDCGGESAVSSVSTIITSPSSEEDRWSTWPSLWGEETAGRASDPWEGAVDLAGEDRDKDEPVSEPSSKSTCDPHDNSHRCATTAAGTDPAGSRTWPLSSKMARRERSTWSGRSSQSWQAAPSRAAVHAPLPNRRCTNRVYPHPRDSVGREEHTILSAVRSPHLSLIYT